SGARAQLAQIAIRVNPRVVPVAPRQAERILADHADVRQLGVGSMHEAALVAVPLAAGARTPAAQIRERIVAHVPVRPRDAQIPPVRHAVDLDWMRRATRARATHVAALAEAGGGFQ